MVRLLVDNSFRLGDWVVEPDLNRVVRSAGPIKLKPRVMQLLVYLAEHAAKVVTKEAIVRDVWDGACVTDDALTYTISELRKALGDDAKAPRFIQTIPKKGYRLIARLEAESSPVPSSLYRISSDMNGVGERSISEAGVETVILGSFMKAGNNISASKTRRAARPSLRRASRR